jgi:diamine N-acetyltransferase
MAIFARIGYDSRMADVVLRPIKEDNWEEALTLTVRPEQTGFIPTVAESMAKAYIKPGGLNYDPYAVYTVSGVMIGFLSYLTEDGGDPNIAYLSGFFIDKAHQGRGYGRAALRAFLAMVREKQPRCRDVRLTVHPDNVAARALYESMGFAPTGLVLDGEDVYRVPLRITDDIERRTDQ